MDAGQTSTMVRDFPIEDRPLPVPPVLAGRRQQGGWLDSRGRFYPAEYQRHIHIGFLLRHTGDGPADPFDAACPGWIMVKCHGEVVGMPGRLTQAQYDSLGDMLVHAPDGPYRRNLLDSLRTLQQMEESIVR